MLLINNEPRINYARFFYVQIIGKINLMYYLTKIF